LTYSYTSPIIFLNTPSGAEIPFTIDIACSGLYSLIGFTLFAVFIAYIARGPLQKKLVVLLLGLPLIYSLNILRIVLLIIIGYSFGPNLALNIFHLLGGWTLILVGTLILLTVAEKAVKIQIFKKKSETCPYCNENRGKSYCLDCGKILQTTQNVFSKTDAAKLTLILAITSSLLFIQVPVFALTRGAAGVSIQKQTGEQAATNILPELGDYTLRFVLRDVAFENISGQDASLIYQYFPKNISKSIIWVGLEIGPNMGCLHPWELCLITWPQTQGREAGVTQLDLRDIHLLENPPLSARYFAFQKKGSNNTEVILYWYTRSIFTTKEGYQKKWSRISVIAYTHNPKKYRAVEDEILPISKAIANYWNPITTWSWAALTIAENGSTLIAATCIILLGTLLFSLYLERKRRKNAKQIYSYISNPEDRQILDAIIELKQLATAPMIASKFRELSGRDIDIETLDIKLSQVEEAGLIQRNIINVNDDPYIIWEIKF